MSRFGADFRSAQIFEICREAGWPLRSIAWTRIGLGDRLRAGLGAIASLRRAGVRLRWRDWSLAGYHAVNVTRAIEAHRGARLLVWESTGIAVPAWIARQRGFAVVALPQSLESLNGTLGGIEELREEAARLSLADRVFCISEEEACLLANLGLSADWLPYFPEKARREALSRVAAIRAAGDRGDAPWLVIGTAHYPPNREGMRRLLRWLEPAARAGLRVTVVGYGTESLAGDFPGSPMAFLGAVSEEALSGLLAGARGILVHQDRGGGVITRIPDSLIAGIPIVASRFAARGAVGYSGIQIYNTPGEMLALVHAVGSGRFPPPPPPAAAQERFAEVLRELAARADAR